MTDKLSRERRSANMRAVRGRDTKPEMIVRRTAHGFGYRYRLHRKELPGSPDLVFGSRRKVIFVHGCFWHRHKGCRKATVPRSNADFWRPKLAQNAARDRDQITALRKSGWGVLVVWECETKDLSGLRTKIKRFLR